jgi:hypothetical protein
VASEVKRVASSVCMHLARVFAEISGPLVNGSAHALSLKARRRDRDVPVPMLCAMGETGPYWPGWFLVPAGSE